MGFANLCTQLNKVKVNQSSGTMHSLSILEGWYGRIKLSWNASSQCGLVSAVVSLVLPLIVLRIQFSALRCKGSVHHLKCMLSSVTFERWTLKNCRRARKRFTCFLQWSRPCEVWRGCYGPRPVEAGFGELSFQLRKGKLRPSLRYKLRCTSYRGLRQNGLVRFC